MRNVTATAITKVEAICPDCGQIADYANDYLIEKALQDYNESNEMEESEVTCLHCKNHFFIDEIIF